MTRKNGKAEERNALFGFEDTALVLVEAEPERCKTFLDAGLRFPQKHLVVMKDHEVIHIAEVIAAAEVLLDEVGQGRQDRYSRRTGS